MAALRVLPSAERTRDGFLYHNGHLIGAADEIAARHGAIHVNATDPSTGQRYGRFEAEDGDDVSRHTIGDQVRTEIEACGGLERLLCPPDRKVWGRRQIWRYLWWREGFGTDDHDDLSDEAG